MNNQEFQNFIDNLSIEDKTRLILLPKRQLVMSDVISFAERLNIQLDKDDIEVISQSVINNWDNSLSYHENIRVTFVKMHYM